MATITTQTIKVDLTPGRVYPVLHVSQGDVGLEALEFYIYQNNQPYTIPAEVTAINIDGMTPVGVFSYPCTWSGNVVTAGLTATMTAEKGVDICELAFYDATNNKIGTCNFVISVEESPFTNAHVSTSDMATIMAAATEVQQNTLLSKSWAVGDTGIRTGEDTNNSKYWAEISESWAVGDTGKRTGENTNNSEYWSTVSHQYANTISFKTYDTVAQMLADTGLLDGGVCRTLGNTNLNDGGGSLYRVSATVPLTQYVTLSNGLYAEKISLPLTGQKISHTNRSLQWLPDCVANWMDHASEIHYEGAHNLFFDDTQKVDGYWPMTCSIFAMAVVYGIDFDHSKYNGLTANEPNPWAYKDDELLELMRNPSGFYSDDILPYLMAKGYVFKPEPKFANVQMGDILYFANGEATPETNFMGVDHCSIFAYHNNDNIYTVWEVGSDAGPVQDTYTYADTEDKCLYVARLPFTPYEEKPIENLLSATTSASATGVEYIQCPIKENFVVGEWYTYICKATNLNATNRPALFEFASSGNIVSYYGGFDKAPYDDVYIMPFRATISLPALYVFPRFVSDGGTVSGDFEWVCLVKGFYSDLNDLLPYFVDLETQITALRTAINGIEIFNDRITTAHTKGSGHSAVKYNRICVVSLDLTLTSNVSTFGVIATIPTGYRPLYQVTNDDVDITASGNIRSRVARNSGTYVTTTLVYICQA